MIKLNDPPKMVHRSTKSIDKEALRIVRAEFIGKTSMGFITGQIYTIETACKMVKRCKISD